MDGPRRRPGGRSARVRTAVLQSALDELGTAGYPGLSFEAVARRAGVHKTTLYRHWQSREDLARDALLARSEAAVPVPDTGSVRDDLVGFGTALISYVSAPEYEAIIRAVASEPDASQALGRVGRDFWQERFRLAEAIVRRGVMRGEVPGSTDSTLLIETLVGAIYLRLLITREPLTRAFVEDVVNLLLA
jgi:AcrR family transcriptional regulator